MNLILPGFDSTKACSICDHDSIGDMTVIVTIIDKTPSKFVHHQIEFSVCEQHSLMMPVSLEKRFKLPEKKTIITL